MKLTEAVETISFVRRTSNREKKPAFTLSTDENGNEVIKLNSSFKPRPNTPKTKSEEFNPETGVKTIVIREEKQIPGPEGKEGPVGPMGPSGKDGLTPIKGKDYFTPVEVAHFLRVVTPVKGKDYFTKEDISEFLEKSKPVKGVDYDDGKDFDEEILNELKEKIKQLEANLPTKFDMEVMSRKGTTWGGSILQVQNNSTYVGSTSVVNFIPGTGINITTTMRENFGVDVTLSSAAGGGWQLEDLTSQIDGLTNTFTLSATPSANSLLLRLNGQLIDQFNDYSLTGDTITMNYIPTVGEKMVAMYQ